MQKYALIVAGGTGSRMQQQLPKQFLPLNGKPVLQYSIEAFYQYDPTIQIIIALHPDFVEYWKDEVLKTGLKIPFCMVHGGKTRFHSVHNGLEAFESEGWVAVHDAARPLITPDFIAMLFDQAAKKGSAIPAGDIVETVRMKNGEKTIQMDRTQLLSIQTPQVFKASELKKAFEQPYTEQFTDEASVMEAAGYSLHFVKGLANNLKITRAEDIDLAAFLLTQR